MDHRFPAWLRWTVKKLDFLALPNLGPLICGLAVLGFIGNQMLGAPLERFVFDPQAVMDGEYFRLFAFPTLSEPLWLLFFCLYVYFVFNMLEESWGQGPVTLFTLFSYVMALTASFVADRPLDIWSHVLENVSLAFGTLFPELEFLLLFILPVKAKYLAILAGVLSIVQFILGGPSTRIALPLVFLPYLIFFGPYLFGILRSKIRKNRNRFR